MPKIKTDVPADETPAQKFARIASNRTNNALNAIRLLEAVGGAGYESTKEQREKIIAALETAVAGVKGIFNGETKPGNEFKL
jgi:hypothetical protein